MVMKQIKFKVFLVAPKMKATSMYQSDIANYVVRFTSKFH